MSDIKMTDEVKNSLVGLLPMNKDSVHEFTPEEFSHIDEELRPIFKLKQFSNEQVNKLKEMILKEAQSTKKKITIKDIEAKNETYMDLLHEVFVGWDNLRSIQGDVYPDYDGTKENLMELPEVIRTTLFAEAMKITGFIPNGVF